MSDSSSQSGSMTRGADGPCVHPPGHRVCPKCVGLGYGVEPVITVINASSGLTPSQGQVIVSPTPVTERDVAGIAARAMAEPDPPAPPTFPRRAMR